VDWTRSAIAGSDGSTYPSIMHVQTGRGFVDDAGSEVVTFNNAVAYLHLEGAAKRRHRVPLYGVPLTRNAIDDPANTGMVMAPFMFRHDDLSPSEYEHMVKCATDVVQWRADAAVFSGRARAMGSGTLLPRPRVHFRDGTVTLQERESQHYQRTDAYGEMVREGVQLSSDVLRAVSDRAAGTVFAGAVKSSQLRIFTRLVNWFIAHGCRAADAPPVDPAWDLARASLLTDNETMAALLGSLVPEAGDGVYVVSCVLARPFHALTDRFRDYHYEKLGYWRDYFADLQQRQLQTPGADTWWTGVDIVDDDPYVVMMEQADYALFYIGHTYGDPRPVPPRYEFLDTLRPLDPTQAHERVQRTVRLMVSAIHRSGLGLDTDHNFLSSKTLVKIIPRVVLQAHEHCKALCRQLEREMRSLVVAHLKRLRTSRGAPEPAAEFTPVEQDAYIAHLRRAEAGSIADPPDAAPGLPAGDDADTAGATDPPEG
ncbi:MAG: hypothetical protein M3O70_07660, partial [Actinomycetota bacterium]|nr:hypothetical protein [Actinomycetota bacterium]